MSPRPSFTIEKRNAPRAFVNDLYYRLVGLDWRFLLFEAFLFFGALNLFFGTLYYLLRDGLRPAGLSFTDCYFFSVHTFSTVGYGSISPVSLAVNLMTVIEVFCGLVSMAMLAGLCFAKFSRPTARFLFTKYLLCTHYRGRRALLIRLANARANLVMNAEVVLTVMYNEVTPEGISYRRLEDLPLERPSTPVFILSMTCAHFVEPGGFTEKLLGCIEKNEQDVEFLVSVRGTDETLGQTVHDMYVFKRDAVVFDRHFEDIVSISANGVRVIDFLHFHELKK